MFNKFLQLIGVLTHIQKKRLLFLLILMVASSFLEIFTIILLINFVTILSSDGIISNNLGFIEKIFQTLGFEFFLSNFEIFSLFLISVLVLNSLVNLINIYFTSKFSLTTGGEIESNLFQYYLKKNYIFHLNSSSSKLMNNIFELVRRVSNFVLHSSLTIISKLIFLLPLLTGLLIYKPVISLITIILIFVSYIIFFKIFKGKLSYLGKLETDITENKYSVIQEAINGIKEVKILYKFNFFKKIYDNLFLRLVKIEVTRDIIGKFPKYFIESFFFIFVILIILYLFSNLNFSFNEIIVSLSTFIICSYKIIPAFQQIYYNLTVIRNHLPALDEIVEDLKKSNVKEFDKLNNKKIYSNKSKFSNYSSVSLKNLSFEYEPNSKILNNINFNFNRSEKVALVGLSGSGKTTLINIILGLIEPKKGEILVDQNKISNLNIREWQKIIGFVPQSIFLMIGQLKKILPLA